jgi:alkylhydroperoxidase family enzyme
MAYIQYLPQEQIPEQNRVADNDNIIQIHSVHSETMVHHFEMYIELMRRRGELTRVQREFIAVVVSAVNECHY